jgi:hypothetical protein
MDATDVLVENLREALRRVQWSVTVGLTASLSLVLLQFSALAPGVTQPPGPVVPVDPVTAKLLLGAAHIVGGFLALVSLWEAGRIAGKINDATIRDAALRYPSFATSPGLEVRLPACLLPPLLFVIAVVWWAVTGAGEHDRAGFIIFAVCFGAAPYCAVAYHAQRLIPAPTVPGVDDQPGTGHHGPAHAQERGSRS